MKTTDEIDAYIAKFEKEHFYSKSLPDDVKKLINYQKSKALPFIFETIEVGLRKLGETHPLITHTYLNEADRSNMDTMANVQAGDEITKNMGIIAFGESCPEGVIGFWPMDSDEKALFSLDTEGQYHLCLGETLLETLYFETIVGDNEAGKVECEKLFRELDIPIPSEITSDEIYAQVDARKAKLIDHPQKRCVARYYEIKSEPDKIVGYKPSVEKTESNKVVGNTSTQDKADKPKFWQFWKRN